MSTMTTLPRGRPLTVDDLATMPDDGHRYELIDGSLVVTPAPTERHQTAVGELHLLLRAQCPAALKVLLAPFDVVLADDTLVQPDLLVATRGSITDKNLPAAPLLAVEVLSPSTALIDLNLKKARYEAAGVASYWVVDPRQPRLRAWELRDGAYFEAADVADDEQWTSSLPYAVTIVPAHLVD